MSDSYDVVIVGAGFAGITAARELRHAGHEVLVVEARDRIGGRTWTRDVFGRRLDMGGTWVHWIQPHVWAEITRYGVGVVSSPAPSHGIWIADGKRHTGTAEELLQLIDRGMAASTEEALTRFPRPYSPLSTKDELEEVDKLSMRDKLEQLDLSAGELDAVEGMWATNFNGSTTAGAYTQGLRWCALAGGSWQLMFEACATYKLTGGTHALIHAMFADADVEVRYDSVVTEVAQDDGAATVHLADGTVLHAGHVIVTTPLNALGAIRFTPALHPAKVRASEEGQTSSGVKVWARLRGEYEPFVALAPGDHFLTLAQVEYVGEGETIVVAFGSDAGRLDASDAAAVSRALREWLPEADVVEVASHDWVADPFARETWPMLRCGQLTQSLEKLQRPEGSVILAGSDYADGWAGFIDGAIESGLRSAQLLKAGREPR